MDRLQLAREDADRLTGAEGAHGQGAEAESVMIDGAAQTRGCLDGGPSGRRDHDEAQDSPCQGEKHGKNK